MPYVTVLMPVYNGEQYLEESIDSIISQTFTDFEFIIVDDGSTDKTPVILNRYTDARIIKLRNPENLGMTNALNRGLLAAQGKFIARMDADDISLPERLAKQVAFMENNPQVGLCGTWIQLIDSDRSKDNILKLPTDDATLRCELLFDSPLAHPSVMFNRKQLFANQLAYNPSYQYCQDYDLWVRCSTHFALANIPEVLLNYRFHPKQMGRCYSESSQRLESGPVRLVQLEHLGLSPTPKEFEIHHFIARGGYRVTPDFVQQAHNWLVKIKLANDKTAVYSNATLGNVLAHRWLAIVNPATTLGLFTWQLFRKSTLKNFCDLSRGQMIRLWLNCCRGQAKQTCIQLLRLLGFFRTEAIQD